MIYFFLLNTSFMSHLLVHHCKRLQVHNDPTCGSEPYTCQRSVSLFLPWEGEVRLYATNVTFKGRRSAEHPHSECISRTLIALCTSLRPHHVCVCGFSLQLPHHIHKLQLEQISQYVLVTQELGFTLAWDGHSGSVYIKLSPEFVGRTCGLCGNFNADIQDDLKTSYGRNKTATVFCDFSMRWKAATFNTG